MDTDALCANHDICKECISDASSETLDRTLNLIGVYFKENKVTFKSEFVKMHRMYMKSTDRYLYMVAGKQYKMKVRWLRDFCDKIENLELKGVKNEVFSDTTR